MLLFEICDVGCEPQIVIPSLRNYYEEWIERKISPLVRLSTAKRHRLCFEAIILPELAAALFQEITKTRLEAFRAKLLRGKTQRGTTRTVKAVRNIVDWHLQSLWRDAEREGYAGPFPRLDWPRTHRARPRPFDSDERDAIVAWFAQNDPYWCPCSSFCFGAACDMAKSLRCDGLTSI